MIELFYRLFRKKGVLKTLNLLDKSKTGRMYNKSFLKEFDKIGYYNEFFRVKQALINYKLITFEFGKRFGKRYAPIIVLTPKGKEIIQLIRKIEMILKNE